MNVTTIITRGKPAIRPQPKRDNSDYWPTQKSERNALCQMLRHEPALAGPIWECAAGARHLVDALRADGRDVFATGLEPGHADIEQLDFLGDPLPPAARSGRAC